MSQNKFTVQKSLAISAGAGSGKTYTLKEYENIRLEKINKIGANIFNNSSKSDK